MMMVRMSQVLLLFCWIPSAVGFAQGSRLGNLSAIFRRGGAKRNGGDMMMAAAPPLTMVVEVEIEEARLDAFREALKVCTRKCVEP